jgi:hypothetical protein
VEGVLARDIGHSTASRELGGGPVEFKFQSDGSDGVVAESAPGTSLRQVAHAAETAAGILVQRPGAIVIVFDPSVPKARHFDAGRALVLASHQLLDGIYTYCRIASLVWVN